MHAAHDDLGAWPDLHTLDAAQFAIGLMNGHFRRMGCVLLHHVDDMLVVDEGDHVNRDVEASGSGMQQKTDGDQIPWTQELGGPANGEPGQVLLFRIDHEKVSLT